MPVSPPGTSGSVGLFLASLSGFISPPLSLPLSLVAPGGPPRPHLRLPNRHSPRPHPAGRPMLLQAAILRANSRVLLSSQIAAPSSAQALRGSPAPRTPTIGLPQKKSSTTPQQLPWSWVPGFRPRPWPPPQGAPSPRPQLSPPPATNLRTAKGRRLGHSPPPRPLGAAAARAFHWRSLGASCAAKSRPTLRSCRQVSPAGPRGFERSCAPGDDRGLPRLGGRQ